jgi:hypothetical protein
MMGLEELKLVDSEGHKVVELFKSLPSPHNLNCHYHSFLKN